MSLPSHACVQVMAKKLTGYYKQKGVVLRVLDKYRGEIEMTESGDVLQVGRQSKGMGWLGAAGQGQPGMTGWGAEVQHAEGRPVLSARLSLTRAFKVAHRHTHAALRFSP